jgi:hypothetical protein
MVVVIQESHGQQAYGQRKRHGVGCNEVGGNKSCAPLTPMPHQSQCGSRGFDRLGNQLKTAPLLMNFM